MAISIFISYCCNDQLSDLLQGMVEKWLIQVEEMMIKSLMKVTEEALEAYKQEPREKWVQEWPGQACRIFKYYFEF